MADGLRLGGHAAQFLEIGPGDEHAGLAADEHHPVHVLAAFEIAQKLFPIAEHGLAERVGLGAGQVEGDVRDVLRSDVETQCGHVGSFRLCVLCAAANIVYMKRAPRVSGGSIYNGSLPTPPAYAGGSLHAPIRRPLAIVL